MRRRTRVIIIAGIAVLALGAVATLRLIPPRWVVATPGRLAAQRLGKDDVTRLLNSAADATLTFDSFQGQRRCCDLGDPSLQFHADGTVTVEIRGFILEQRATRFHVTQDGQLDFVPTDAALSDWLQKQQLGSAEMYRYGADLYLVRAGSPLKLPPKLDRWPFKATGMMP